MLVIYEDEEYVFDLEDITVGQAKIIQAATGHTLMTLEKGLENADPGALVAMFWLMQVMNGHAMPIERVDFKIVKFANALQAATERERDEREAEEAAAKKSGKPREAPKAQIRD